MKRSRATARTRTVSWEDPAPALAVAAGMSGLEYIRALFEGRLPPPPIAVTMGFVGGEAAEGKAVFLSEAGEYLYNPIGVVHGGFAMTLLDSAMGCAVHTTLARGERYTTLETKGWAKDQSRSPSFIASSRNRKQSAPHRDRMTDDAHAP